MEGMFVIIGLVIYFLCLWWYLVNIGRLLSKEEDTIIKFFRFIGVFVFPIGVLMGI